MGGHDRNHRRQVRPRSQYGDDHKTVPPRTVPRPAYQCGPTILNWRSRAKEYRQLSAECPAEWPVHREAGSRHDKATSAGFSKVDIMFDRSPGTQTPIG